MRHLTLLEALVLQQRIINQSGGLSGIRDLGALESALAQPRMTFEGEDLYKTILEKASTLGFSLVSNHPFLDGNKRVGHALMEVFLVLNGFEIQATTDEQERVIFELAAGKLSRADFTRWVHERVISR